MPDADRSLPISTRNAPLIVGSTYVSKVKSPESIGVRKFSSHPRRRCGRGAIHAGRLGTITGLDEVEKAHTAQPRPEHPGHPRECHVGVHDGAALVENADEAGQEIGDGAPRRGVVRRRPVRRCALQPVIGVVERHAASLGDGQLERQPASGDVVANPAQGLDVVHRVPAMSGHRPPGESTAWRRSHARMVSVETPTIAASSPMVRARSRLPLSSYRRNLRSSTVDTRASLPWALAPTGRQRPGARLNSGPPTITGMPSARTAAIVAVISRGEA